MLLLVIDWSDASLDYFLQNRDQQKLAQGSVKPDVAGLADLFSSVEAHARPGEIGVAIETCHGAWIQAFLDRGCQVYPVNPNMADHFRKTLSANGEKTDEIDARVLSLYLLMFLGKMRPLRPDDPEVVSLRIACEDRVRLVQERTDKLNELGAILKCHYPAFLGLFGDLNSGIALDFLREFPTQGQMQSLTEKKLRHWLQKAGYSCPNRIPEMVEHLKTPALRVEDHLQKAKAPLITYLAVSIETLNREIKSLDDDIDQKMQKLPEAEWAKSLPGAGPVLAPALLACVGRDAKRFASVSEARALMGTAPVTKQSGKTRMVHFRFGCWKFARRTLHLFADESRRFSRWASEFYKSHRASGHGHHATLRALAHKWLKIILAMQRTGKSYDERIFINSRQKHLVKSAL